MNSLVSNVLSFIIGNVQEMVRLAIHMEATAIDIAPLILFGKISDNSTQVTGPQLMAKAAV